MTKRTKDLILREMISTITGRIIDFALSNNIKSIDELLHHPTFAIQCHKAVGLSYDLTAKLLRSGALDIELIELAL